MQTEMKQQQEKSPAKREFLVNYYIGHCGRFGHEYLEFEFKQDGNLRYYNSTKYKNQDVIRKEVYANQIVLDQLKKIIRDSNILNHTSEKWPAEDKTGKQTLTIHIDGRIYKYETSKIGSFSEVQNCDDPQGLTVFFYLVQDLKSLVFSLVNLHFRIRPV